jgi:hypothetical protein
MNEKLQRAISVDQLLKMKFKTFPFDGEYKDAVGTPAKDGSWIVWGQSANGKTRFVLALSKYLANFARIAYMTLEEGAKLSFQRAIQQNNMLEVAKNFTILENESIEDLTIRLHKKKSADVIIIDSIQYWQVDYMRFKNLKEEFPNKLFIIISHADGKEPKGATAKAIRFDADVKIFIQGYRAFPDSRFGGGKPFTIWNEGADLYWSKLV